MAKKNRKAAPSTGANPLRVERVQLLRRSGAAGTHRPTRSRAAVKSAAIRDAS